MSKKPARFTEADLQRVIKAAQKAKQPVAAVQILPDGTIQLVFGEPENVRTLPGERGWDRALGRG